MEKQTNLLCPIYNTLVRLPLILRTVSGFVSTLTSAFISLLFTFTIYKAVLETDLGYPGEYKLVLMIIAPVISSWQFLNVSSTLAALFKTLKENETETQLAASIGVVTHRDVSIEHSVFGMFNVLMRALAGFITCMTVCTVSVMFTYVMHKGIINGIGYPKNSELTVVIIGPIIMSWTFMRASTTIKQLLKLETVSDRLKQLLLKLISIDKQKQ